MEGATALKLDESYQLDDQEQTQMLNSHESLTNDKNFEQLSNEINSDSNNFSSGVSIENASYIEKNNLAENEEFSENNNEEEYTPKLFSDDHTYQSDEMIEETDYQTNNETEKLFDQDDVEEEDFEIPAFLRKQKF